MPELIKFWNVFSISKLPHGLITKHFTQKPSKLKLK